MIFVTIIPSFIWITLLAWTWWRVADLAWNRLRVRHRVMKSLLIVMVLQALVAMSVAVATSLDQISAYAGLMGALGAFGIIALFFVKLVAIGFLSRIWPRSSEGGRKQFPTWLAIWIFFGLVVFLTHLRSALMCTV